MNPIFIIRRFVLLAYAFTMWSWTYEHISQEICLTSDEEENDHGGGISSATVAKYHNHFRDVIGTYYFMQKSLLHLNMAWQVLFRSTRTSSSGSACLSVCNTHSS